jgi:crotonobetainyl-CoA:carnitine CoA-transferase CaiB-like acyl-CoA transferase
MAGPLTGLVVADFTQLAQGPFATQMLGDLGAEIIKIEPLKGDWMRHWSMANLYIGGEGGSFLSFNRNKRSVALDLKNPAGLEAALRIIDRADVVIENFRPGVMERLGLGWEAVRAWNPRLVYVSASGYGESSPHRDRPGQDLLLQALSGLASISGRAGQPPTPVGTAVVDQHGATLLAMGVLAALLERGRTGQGVHVEVSMLRAAFDLQLEIVTYFLNGARLAKSPTSLASMFHPGPYGCYETRDGWLVLSMSPLKVLQEALDLPALAPYATVPYNFTAREDIARLLEPVMKDRTTQEWVDFLAPRGVWVAPIRTHAEAFADPVVQAADAVEDVDHPVAGRVRLLRFPVELSSGRATVRRPPPMPGEHAEEILRELGYPDADVRRLREQRVV